MSICLGSGDEGGSSMYKVYDNAHEEQTRSVGRPDRCWELDFLAPGVYGPRTAGAAVHLFVTATLQDGDFFSACSKKEERLKSAWYGRYGLYSR